MLLWICMPGFGQVFFWTAGACNYFWGLALCWFLIWRTLIRIKRRQAWSMKDIPMMILAFVAGAWSEHLSFAALMVLICILLWQFTETGKILWAPTLLFCSGCAGYLYLMLAPASKLLQRLQSFGAGAGDGSSSLLGAVPGGILTAGLIGIFLLAIVLIIIKKAGISRGVKLLASVLCIAGFVMTLYFAVCAWREDGIFGLISSTRCGFGFAMSLFLTALAYAAGGRAPKNSTIFSVILAFSGICGFALFVFGEYLPIRGFCAPVAFSLLAVVILIESVPEKEAKKLAGFSVLALCFLLCFYMGVKDIVSVYQQSLAREAEFYRAAAGDKTVITGPYRYRTKYTAQFGNVDLVYDAGWPNGVMADYYDVIRIIVEE
ncbi:MAG: hypothetical protein IJV40_13175 [Oscillospiraceae bacterium]|nr:hypothetical protein [Oscillospiraceae bacterium]